MIGDFRTFTSQIYDVSERFHQFTMHFYELKFLDAHWKANLSAVSFSFSAAHSAFRSQMQNDQTMKTKILEIRRNCQPAECQRILQKRAIRQNHFP